MAKIVDFFDFVHHVQNVQYQIGGRFEKPDDDWTSTLVLVDDHNHMLVSPVLLRNIEDKETMVKTLVHYFRIVVPDHAAFVASSWLRKIEAVDPQREEILKNALENGVRSDPQREEVLFLVAASYDGRQIEYQAPIRRQADQPPTLGAWTEWENPQDVTGRFGTMFKDAFAACQKKRQRRSR